jgi:hypothetical protein
MLRLAHRVLETANHSLVSWARLPAVRDKINFPRLVEQMDKMKRRVSESQIIIADNVADYLAAHPQQEWDLHDDFHCVTPPFMHTFIEWRSPEKVLLSGGWEQQPPNSQVGWSFLCPDDKRLSMVGLKALGAHIDDKNSAKIIAGYEKSKWIVMADLFVFMPGLPCMWAGSPTWIFISDEGRIVEEICCPINPNMAAVFRNPCDMMNDALLALSFMHCKNVVRRDATESEGPPAKWLRRMKQPTLRYHVLEIDPMKEVLRREGGSETNGLKKALHICRGHFATFTEARPLFGKYAGTFWKPAHVRGTKEQGVVVKDYAVNAPR